MSCFWSSSVSLQHLDSGLWCGGEQARPRLASLGDLWRRLIAPCCVWDSVALRQPAEITALSPPPASLLLVRSVAHREGKKKIQKLSAPFFPFRQLLSPERDNKTHMVTWLPDYRRLRSACLILYFWLSEEATINKLETLHLLNVSKRIKNSSTRSRRWKTHIVAGQISEND